MTGGNPDPQITGNKMPQKRDRKPMAIFVIAGKDAVKQFKDLNAAEKAMSGKDFVVIRGHRLEKHVTTKYI